MAIDPVNGVEVDEAAARTSTGQTIHGANEVDPALGTRYFHGGRWYYFSSVENRLKFIANPALYVTKAATPSSED